MRNSSYRSSSKVQERSAAGACWICEGFSYSPRVLENLNGSRGPRRFYRFVFSSLTPAYSGPECASRWNRVHGIRTHECVTSSVFQVRCNGNVSSPITKLSRAYAVKVTTQLVFNYTRTRHVSWTCGLTVPSCIQAVADFKWMRHRWRRFTSYTFCR